MAGPRGGSRRGRGGGERATWEAVGAIAAAVAALAAVVGLVLADLGDDGDGDGNGSTTTTAVGSTTTGLGSTTTSSGQATTSTTERTTTTEDPAGPDLALFLEPGCSIVGQGGVSGDDVISFLFRARNVGEVDYAGTIRTSASSDSGLGGSSVGGVTDDSASSFVQVELAPQDYGRTHIFTIAIEATESLEETDEFNNRDVISVPLPPSPPASGQTIDPCA